MPFTSFHHTTVLFRAETESTQIVETGHLVLISTNLLTNPDNLMAVYANIGLMSGGIEEQHIIAHLAKGFIDTLGGITWTGRLLLQPGLRVFIRAYGVEPNLVVKLNYATEL